MDLSWPKSGSVTVFCRLSSVICETKRQRLKFLLFSTVLFCHRQSWGKKKPPPKHPQLPFKKKTIRELYGKTKPTPTLSTLVMYRGSASKRPRVALPQAARCYLPGEGRQKYILHFLSDWTLRHPDCSLCNLNVAAQMAARLARFRSRGASALCRRGAAAAGPSASVPLSPQRVKPLYRGPECHPGLNGSSAEGYG